MSSGIVWSLGGSDTPQRGLTPRLCEDLFQRISTKVEAEAEASWAAKVEVSYMDIYLEMVRDLLGSKSGPPTQGPRASEHCALRAFLACFCRGLDPTHNCRIPAYKVVPQHMQPLLQPPSGQNDQLSYGPNLM